MEHKIGFFDEAEGVRSSTRLFSQQTLLFSFAVTGYQVYTNTVDELLILFLFTAALAPKAIQKFGELRAGKP